MKSPRKVKFIPQSPLTLRSQNRKVEGTTIRVTKVLNNAAKQKDFQAKSTTEKKGMKKGALADDETTSGHPSLSLGGAESLNEQLSSVNTTSSFCVKNDNSGQVVQDHVISDSREAQANNVKLEAQFVDSDESISTSSTLTCSNCSQQFLKEETLSEHSKKCSSSTLEKKLMSCIFASCKETYTSKRSLMSHLRTAHGSKLAPSEKLEQEGSEKQAIPGKLIVPLKRTKEVYKCPSCNGHFRRTDNFERHYEKCSTSTLKKRRTPCVVSSCTETFSHKFAMVNHLKDVHSAKISPPQILTFQTETEYKLWKDDEESRTFSYFSSESGCKKYKVGSKGSRKYFYCQYDGPLRAHRKKGEPERLTSRKRKSGQVKTGMVCLARMVVTTLPDGSVHVEYHPTHNHKPDSSDCAHQPATSSVNDHIQNQIALRVPPTVIYESLQSVQYDGRNKERGKPVPRSIAVSKRAIQQRAIKFRKTMRLHEEDSISTCLLVERLRQEEYDPIVIYKPPGKPIVGGPPGINCLPEDIDSLFMLGLQTKEQKCLMLEGCKKVLIVDTARYVTQFENSKLLNFIVINENNRGVAVAHFITNYMTADVIGYFVEALRLKFEEDGQTLKINCVMSGDDPLLIKGIQQGMGLTLPHILCLWNVDRALQDALQKKVVTSVKDQQYINLPDLKDQIYSDLMGLVNCNDKLQFEELAALFKDKYISDAPKFVNYFEKNYMNTPEKWAKCHRENLGDCNIDSISFAEFFQNRLKTGFSQRVSHIRVDDLVNHLLDIEKYDKTARQREANDRISATTEEVEERHNNSLLMPDDSIGEKSSKLWLVNSSKNDEVYKIECLWEICQKNDCCDKCPSASCSGLCSHLYHCTCPDTVPLCKHIHKLHSLLTQNSCQPEEEMSSELFQIGNDDSVDSSDVEDCYSNLHNGLATLCGIVEKRQVPSHLLETCVATITSLIEKCQVLQKNQPVLDFVELSPEKNVSVPDVQLLPLKEGKNDREDGNDANVMSAAKSVKIYSGNNDNLLVLKSENNNDESSEDVDDPAYVTIDNPIDPLETLLCIGDININLLHVKSLDLDLNEEEARTYKIVSPSFRVGWMLPDIVNAFLSILSSSNDKTYFLSTDSVLSLFHGDLLPHLFNNEMPEKNIFIFPLSLSENHWAILVLFADKAEMRCLDPIMGKLTPDLIKLVHSVNSIMKIVRPDISRWSLRFISHLNQTDAVNSGVHICWFAHEAILQYEKHSPLSDIREYRKFICDTICGHCLDYSQNDDTCALCRKEFLNIATISCCKCGRSFHCECISIPLDSSDFVCPLRQ
ncbi:uncharacterized protein LOC113209736 [Frankliniella occidentalis]|uniref:Uncharacterized protein LOC113209736 n=1 Tax=Frankliniella occidentalis TaxID=133901 RepID=A0A9C6X4I7_FRAOC|nr:uncharacterized protein LOC113209736 [Frankliniella occidentalis]